MSRTRKRKSWINQAVLTAALAVGATLVATPSVAEDELRWSERTIQRCAASISCPGGLTPDQANSVSGGTVSLEQSLRWCAAGQGCSEGMTRERAQILEGENPQLSRDERNAALIRCARTGICPGNFTPDAAEAFIEPVPTADVTDTPEARAERERIIDAIRECAGGGACSPQLDPQTAQDIYSTPARIDRTLRLCVANLGCPGNLTPDNADALLGNQGPLTPADIHFSLTRCARTGVCPPGVAPETAQDILDNFPSPEMRPVYACFELSMCPTGMTPRDAWARIERERAREDYWASREDGQDAVDERGLIFLPFDEAGSIAIAIAIEAAATNQNVPIYDDVSDFMAERLAGFSGDGEGPFGLGGGLLSPGMQELLSPFNDEEEMAFAAPPEPSQSDTHEVVGFPQQAPPRITASRANEFRNLWGQSAASTTVSVEQSNTYWGIEINADIQTNQFAIERRGSERIATRPTTNARVLAYIPVDLGGPAITVSIVTTAFFNGGSGSLSIVPYVDLDAAEVTPVSQAWRAHSLETGESAQEAALLQALSGQFSAMTGMVPPVYGDQAEFLEFTFEATERGIQRGLVVSFQASAAPDILSARDTIRTHPINAGRVTEISESADFRFRGQVVVTDVSPTRN